MIHRCPPLFIVLACIASLLLILPCTEPAFASQRRAGSLRAREPQLQRSARVLLIPLDDRPPCVQFVEMIGRLGDTEVVAPPRAMLGRFTEPGNPEAISRWVLNQNLRRFDAVIVSVDMLAYGGLVNSRVFRTSQTEARERLRLIDTIRRRAPGVPIYGFNVIMRLAPTDSPTITAFRDKLARWAEISPYRNEESLRAEVARLEQSIPAAALEDYKNSRARNFQINQASIALVRRGVFDYLILSQDDAKPRGIHVADRERLIAEAARLNLNDRVAIQPGADEVAMLLLSRALTKRFNRAPSVHAVYSSSATRDNVAPFEDRPLNRTVSFHIAAAGGREVADADAADILFYVYGSRAEQGVAQKFVADIEDAVARNRRVIVADIDYKGDVQGADPVFTEALRRRKVFPRLTGYASWNTAGNTIGTALPHGIVYTVARERIVSNAPARARRIGDAQIEFLLHRLIDDYAYHGVVRPEAKRFAATKRLNPNGLAGAAQTEIEEFIRNRMRPHVESLWRDFSTQPFVVAYGARRSLALMPRDFANFRMDLPWGRTFEAAIDFDVRVEPIARIVNASAQSEQ